MKEGYKSESSVGRGVAKRVTREVARGEGRDRLDRIRRYVADNLTSDGCDGGVSGC